jgi:hypothetical protein
MSETDTEIVEPVKKNKGGRPRKVAPVAPTLSGDQFAQLIAAITAASSGNAGNSTDMSMLKELMAGAAIVAANHTDKVQNPSNKAHPAISAFSYPEGDLARPKPLPPFQFIYAGYPCTKWPETEHWRELELMCEVVKPGVYPIIRKDGSKMNVTVIGEYDVDGSLSKVEVFFGEKDHKGNFARIPRSENNLIPPKAVVLYQIVHAGTKPVRQLFVEGMTDWMNLTIGDAVAV